METSAETVLSAAATPTSVLLTNHVFASLNATSSFLRNTSAKDVALLPLRAARQIDHVVFRKLPRYLLQATGLINVATGNEPLTLPALNAAGEALGAGAGAAPADTAWGTIIAEAFQASTFKSYWGMLQYLTSRWAFTCFALALLLNRVNVYGASRQRIFLSWNKRLALRLIPIMLLVPQIYHLLCAMRCQTSPDYSLYRHGDNSRFSTLDWATDGGPLHTLSASILFSQTDAQACAAVGMSRPEPDVRAPSGSFSLLWPTFLRLALTHLVESLSCSLQQIPLMTEVGMSVFEHSLAFAEAESMITSTISLLAKEARRASDNSTTAEAAMATTTASTAPRGMVMASGTVMALSDALSALTSPHILDRINVPVEVLLVALLSACNALCSNLLAVAGKQHRWRLVNTAVWGLLFMGSFCWAFITPSHMLRADERDKRPVSSLLHFPTVAIIGFLPHMVILLGIVFCLNIYLVALTLTAFSLGTNSSIPQPTSLRDRFRIAHENLTAAIQLRGIKLRWAEDFYTALLRVGFTALTAASEAVFLHEGRAVEMRQFTWLEEDRLDELHLSRSQRDSPSSFQILEEYGIPSISPSGTDKGGAWESGFSKERKIDKKEGELSGTNSFAYPTPRQDGVGAVQRTTRFYLLFIYVRGIMFLVAGWVAYGAGILLDKIGITNRPRWLRRVVGRSLKGASHERDRINADSLDLTLWAGNVPTDPSLDVECEMRRNIERDYKGEEAENMLEDRMYQWWKTGGWLGTNDNSGEYQPSRADDGDTTSIYSMSTAASITSDANQDEWEDEPEGARTPTQSTDPVTGRETWSFSHIDVRNRSRHSTPASDTHDDHIDNPLDTATLARLLNPQDKESREEARILASHLSYASSSTFPANPTGIMTRSRYRAQNERDRARLLLAGRTHTNPPITTTTARPSIFDTPSDPPPGPRPLAPQEEETLLESLILQRRSAAPVTPQDRRDAVEGGPVEGSGVLCVVCQTTPRTIIAWPCRCLCVCEDCRLSLAMNNFGNCVTCRRTVQGFVRLYVP
jgi:hypothetical protein